MGQGESKKKEKEDSLKQLTEKGVEAWTVADVKEWIRLQECGPELQKLTEEFQIDGDGILMVEFEELIQLKKNGGKWKLPKQESLQRFVDLMKSKQKEEVDRQISYTIPSPDVNTLFPPVALPSSPNSTDFVFAYHERSKNTDKKGAFSLSRDWTSQPRVWRRYYGAPYLLLPIPNFSHNSGEEINNHNNNNSNNKSNNGRKGTSNNSNNSNNIKGRQRQRCDVSDITVRSYNDLYNSTQSTTPSTTSTTEIKLQPPTTTATSTAPSTTTTIATNITGHTPSAPVTMNSISLFLFCSVAVSARKPAWQLLGQPRAAWSKRCNASSGGLHPCECYLILPPITALEATVPAGVYHYSPKEHGLEQRTQWDHTIWEKLTANLPPDAFFVGISSVNWREIWKYGERGFRYCHLDIGHMLASLTTAAALLAWRVHVISGLPDSILASLFGIKDTKYFSEIEREFPALLCVVVPATNLPQQPTNFSIPTNLEQLIDSSSKWHGVPNTLTFGGHVEWPIVSHVTKHTACMRNAANNNNHNISVVNIENSNTNSDNISDSNNNSNNNNNASNNNASNRADQYTFTLFPHQPQQQEGDNEFFSLTKQLSPWKPLRERRSAHDFSPKHITIQQFKQLIGRIVPSVSSHPWSDISDFSGNIHMGIYVYRVTGLQPGYYMLLRPDQQGDDHGMLEKLKETTREKGFLWQHVSELPPVTHATPAVVHQTTEQQEQQQEQQQAQSQVEEQTLQQQSENELPHPTEHESQPSQSQAKQDQQQPQPQQQQTEQQQQPQQQTHPLQALPLYFLKAGEKDVVADEAATASCHQNMVSQSAFCICMFSEMHTILSSTNQPELYRQMMWEAGVIGQVLYNEAYALNLKATGLGCFLDDMALTSFGLESSAYQTMYHFTVGAAIQDIRYPAFAYEVDMFSITEDDDV